jgi:hypothetical protein
MPYRRVVDSVGDTGAWALFCCPERRPLQAGTNDTGRDPHLIFFGSQTSFFFFTTAPQSLHRKRPGLSFAVDLPSLHFM